VDLLYPRVMDAVRQVTEAVFEPSVGLVMTARRWAWILSGVDSSKRPYAVPNQQGPFNAMGVTNAANASFVDNLTPAGWFAGYPVFISELLPKTNGASTSEDVIVSGAFEEAMIWTEQNGPRTFQFDEVGSQTATIRCSIFGYVGLTWGRYPAASSKITGTGLIAPNFGS
jgi:hypothetical protein